jgi:hypothetical protein
VIPFISPVHSSLRILLLCSAFTVLTLRNGAIVLMISFVDCCNVQFLWCITTEYCFVRKMPHATCSEPIILYKACIDCEMYAVSMLECISTVRFSVKVNGGSLEPFYPSGGI